MRLQPTSAHIAVTVFVRDDDSTATATANGTTVAAVGGLGAEVGLVAVVAAYIGLAPRRWAAHQPDIAQVGGRQGGAL